MSYTITAVIAVCLSVLIDAKVTKVRLITRKAFWVSYAIILPFQLLTNWWLTSRDIVMYRSGAIIGLRIAAAPAEDLLFGFSLLLGVLTLWVKAGKRS
jgi:lycopene cyclase domain-containing protein